MSDERLTAREAAKLLTLLNAANIVNASMVLLTTTSPVAIAATLGGGNKRMRRLVAELIDAARDDDSYLDFSAK